MGIGNSDKKKCKQKELNVNPFPEKQKIKAFFVLLKQNMIYCIKKVRQRFYKILFPNTNEENLEQVIQIFTELKYAKDLIILY